MGILDKKEIVIDKSIKLARYEAMLKEDMARLYNNIKNQYADIFKKVWNSPRGFTPQEIFDEFNTEAKDLLIFSAQVQNLLKAVDPSYEVPPRPNEITINQNGTVSVGNSI